MDTLEAVVRRLEGEELQAPGLQVCVGAVQVLHSMQHAMDLPNYFHRESWENQVKAQPVEGGLHQREPGEGVLGQEWQQFHLGRRFLLVCRRQ